MTNEQLEKAEILKAEMHGCKNDLEKVIDFQNRISEVCARGICIHNGLNYDTVIVPRDSEINGMLVTMRNRLKNRMAKLQKEFEEL